MEHTSSASRGLLHVDLQQRPLARVHRRVAQLGEVHLAETLQPVEVVLVVRVLGQERRPGRVVLEVDLLLAHQRRVQRRLGHVDEAALDERLHLAEEERQQQRADVAAVDVGVGQQDHLVVADLVDVELLGQAGADGRDQRLDLGVLEHLVDTGPLDVEDLAPDGEDGLGVRVAGVLGRSAGRVALHDEELRLARVARRSSRPACPGSPAPSSADLRRVRSRAPWAAMRARAACIDFCTIWLASRGFSSSHSVSFWLVVRSVSERMDVLPELGLGLALELRVAQADRDDGGQALPDVLALEVLLLLLEEVAGPGVAVDDVGQRLGEALDVHPALNGRDAVGEGVDRLVVAGVPLQRDLDLLALLGLLERRHLAEQRLLGRVEVLDEVDDAAVVLEGRLGHRVGALVGEADLEALVQEGHDLHALDDGLGPELGLVEDGGVGPEGDRGARPRLAGAPVLGRRPGGRRPSA